MGRRIEVRIEKQTAATTVQTEGFSGPSCLEATRALEAKLGKVTRSTPTDEMYATEAAETKTAL